MYIYIYIYNLPQHNFQHKTLINCIVFHYYLLNKIEINHSINCYLREFPRRGIYFTHTSASITLDFFLDHKSNIGNPILGP